MRVEAIKDRLLANNAQTYWVPTYVKDKRFHNWLENAHDWAVSRTRFWGTPLPIWTSEDGKEVVVVGSVAELEQLSGQKVRLDIPPWGSRFNPSAFVSFFPLLYLILGRGVGGCWWDGKSTFRSCAVSPDFPPLTPISLHP